MPRKVGVDHDSVAFGPNPHVGRERAEHAWQPHHQHATVRTRIEQGTVLLNGGRQFIDAAGQLRRQLHGGQIPLGHGGQFKVGVGPEVGRE